MGVLVVVMSMEVGLDARKGFDGEGWAMVAGEGQNCGGLVAGDGQVGKMAGKYLSTGWDTGKQGHDEGAKQ